MVSMLTSTLKRKQNPQKKSEISGFFFLSGDTLVLWSLWINRRKLISFSYVFTPIRVYKSELFANGETVIILMLFQDLQIRVKIPVRSC